MPNEFDADLSLVRDFLANPQSSDRVIQRLEMVPRVLSVLNARKGRPLDEHELADLAQDTVVLVLQKMREYEGRGSWDGWIYRTAELELMNRIRRLRRLRDRFVPLADTDSACADDPAIDAHSHVQAALRRLGEPDAGIVRMRIYDSMTFLAIGKHIGLSEVNAKTRYYRALTRLERILEATGTPTARGTVDQPREATHGS